MHSQRDGVSSRARVVTWGRGSNRVVVGFIALYTVAFLAWVVIRPADHHTFLLVDDVGQALGPAIVISAIAVSGWRHRRHLLASHPVRRQLLRTSVLLVLAVLFNATGQAVYTYEHLVLHADVYPSPAEALFLAAYPCLFAGLLLLLTYAFPMVRYIRLAAEMLLMAVALATFSWYFVLGPLVLVPNPDTLGWLVGLAFPLGDLLLLAVLTVFWGATRRVGLLPPLVLLAGATFIIVVADSVYDYRVAHGAYVPGSIVDAGWPVGYMLIGLAVLLLWRPSFVRELGRAHRGQVESDDLDTVTALPSLVQALTPLALALAVDGLAVVAAIVNESNQYDVSIDQGVYIGATVFLLVLVAHQTLVVLENRRLHSRIRLAQRELEHRNAQLEATASLDPLTGLANRRTIDAALDRQVQSALRYGSRFAVLLLDIDRFKRINDRYGHVVGDAVLQAVGRHLQTAARSCDLVGRWGGEEFVAILPETDGRGAWAAAERLRLAVTDSTSDIRGVGKVTCSVGCAVFPDDARDRDSILELVDKAMYAAKQAGRNQVCMCEPPKVSADAG